MLFHEVNEKAVQLIYFIINKLMKRYLQQQNQNQKQNYHQRAALHNSKKTIHFAVNLREFEKNDEDSGHVEVYLRSSCKKAYKVEFERKVRVRDIKERAQQKFLIKKDEQVLFLNGNNITEYGMVQLNSKCIIHVLPYANLHQKSLQNEEFSLPVLNLLSEQVVSKQLHHCRVYPNQNVATFIARIHHHIKLLHQIQYPNVKIYLLSSSRLLESNKTFEEQEIYQFSSITCLITLNEMQTRFFNDAKEEINNDIADLLKFTDFQPNVEIKLPPKRRIREGRNSIKKQESQKPVSEAQDPVIQDVSQTIPLLIQLPIKRKSISQNQLNDSPNIFSFKKKINRTFSFEVAQFQLATSLKSSKSKKQIEEILKSEEKQKTSQNFQEGNFLSAEVVYSNFNNEMEEAFNVVEVHKPPVIPEVMPIKERRKIMEQFGKLFGGDSSEEKTDVVSNVENSKIKEDQPTINIDSILEAPKQFKERNRIGKNSSLRNSLGVRQVPFNFFGRQETNEME